MNDFLHSNQVKGLLIMGAGILLMLNSLGIIEKGLNAVVIAAAILMVLYGFFIAGYYQKFFKKNNHK